MHTVNRFAFLALALAVCLGFVCSLPDQSTSTQPHKKYHPINKTMSSLNSEDPQSLGPGSELHSPSPSHSSIHEHSSQPTPEHVPQTQDEKEAASQSKSPASSVPEEPQEPKQDYIITLKRNTTPEQFTAYKNRLLEQGAIINHEYNSTILKGFAVSIGPSLLSSFHQDPQVLDIEPDQKVHI